MNIQGTIETDAPDAKSYSATRLQRPRPANGNTQRDCGRDHQARAGIAGGERRAAGLERYGWLVPDAMGNLSPVRDGLTDEQVPMCPEIMSTGFGGAERGAIAA
jgi:hypothetical protein